MGRGNPAIDYPTIVLRKYPDAQAIPVGEKWRIVALNGKWASRADFRDRDDAWHDAAQRVLGRAK